MAHANSIVSVISAPIGPGQIITRIFNNVNDINFDLSQGVITIFHDGNITALDFHDLATITWTINEDNSVLELQYNE
jgi:hypothetical protein